MGISGYREKKHVCHFQTCESSQYVSTIIKFRLSSPAKVATPSSKHFETTIGCSGHIFIRCLSISQNCHFWNKNDHPKRQFPAPDVRPRREELRRVPEVGTTGVEEHTYRIPVFFWKKWHGTSKYDGKKNIKKHENNRAPKENSWSYHLWKDILRYLKNLEMIQSEIQRANTGTEYRSLGAFNLGFFGSCQRSCLPSHTHCWHTYTYRRTNTHTQLPTLSPMYNLKELTIKKWGI